MNLQQKAKTPYEKELAAEIKTLKQQLTDLRRSMTGMERDGRLLSIMSENADRLRRTNEAEKKLHALYNEMLLANCPNLVFVFDTDLKLQLATKMCLSILPYDSVDKMKSRTPEQIFGNKMNPAWIEKISAECHEAMESRKTLEYIDKIDFIDGAGYMHTRSTISPVLEENSGEMRGVLLLLSDITELVVTKERSDDASRSKSSFLANMSHEIRTPMNAIKGLAELLMMTELNDMQQAYVSNIINSSNSLLNIINDILDFSKIDANRVDIIKSEYSLSTLLKDVCSVISMRAAEKNLKLVPEIDPLLPKTLYGDDSRLKQVMLNILSNAVKYTNEGKITFKVKGKMLDDKNIQLHFTVEDTGIGIRHDEISTLFEAFSRADLRLNRGIMGTGLGLAISKNLLLAMEGDIEVKSIYGKGSAFSFWLPQRLIDASPMASVENPSEKKVLILDDNERGAELCAFLDKLGVVHVSLKETRDQGMPGWEDATHCIYYDGYHLSSLGKLRGSMPATGFVIIRDIRHSVDKPKFADMSIYEPLLLTDLADVLNMNKNTGFVHSMQNVVELAGSFKVKDASALVVDDNALNLMVGSEILRSFGFDVVEAESGEAAVKICEKQIFDIIFMDHMMPVMDGIEAATHIREEPGKNIKTPVVVLTANVIGDARDYFLRCGMNDMVSKPIEVPELSRAILAWIPPAKIVKDDSAARALDQKDTKPEPGFDLIKLLDEFGMYAGDVMRELDGDLQVYIARLGQAGTTLGDMVRHLNELVRLEDWPRFSRVIGELKDLLHGVGARDCSARAKKMEIASAEGNISYVHQDFKSLMGNMYMLECKLDSLVPLAMGTRKNGYKPNDPDKMYELLQSLQTALKDKNKESAAELVKELARVSFDHDLDMQLNDVRWAFEDDDFESARKLNKTVIAFFKKKNAISSIKL